MKHLWLFLKGIAMGAADVVPGVSGGTIAFITGIYTELLDSIKSINLNALQTLFKQGPKAAWQAINGTFLLVLGSGVLLALLSLAKVLHYLLLTQPELLWSFFFGLIIASSWHIGKEIRGWNLRKGMTLLAGIIIAAGISLASPSSLEPTPLVLFGAGSIAICAMILPGISGSFILLLMGLYEPVLSALKALDLGVMVLFAGGAGVGLLVFSRILSWCLHHYKDVMFSLLTGFMLGSLTKVWPWKETISTRINSKGEEVPFLQSNILPLEQPVDAIIVAAALMIVGAACVLILEKVAQSR
ncbi:DUF368 domain-containing protein [Bacterioplanoides sp. SCSIO 12839]|uniref:DUF368 domain-containing protein n=1 Tax=Bacterioplanoides sp. SCSIO 12839 TaxID=2829569 RepID=UPI00210531A7|nr:DUF368 domain-containing protein [Bacterioplanoides sp. SCSIO 12839]UTW47652.1 DUF368 domain-containing protein [Bacterioplanoides sp. SCSIO 12839]